MKPLVINTHTKYTWEDFTTLVRQADIYSVNYLINKDAALALCTKLIAEKIAKLTKQARISRDECFDMYSKYILLVRAFANKQVSRSLSKNKARKVIGVDKTVPIIRNIFNSPAHLKGEEVFIKERFVARHLNEYPEFEILFPRIVKRNKKSRGIQQKTKHA